MPKITGSDDAGNRIKRIAGREKVEFVGKALFAAGHIIRAEASRLITENAVSGARHVPSSPGEPPNEDTGHLRTNITVTQTGPLKVEVASNAAYSAALEYGYAPRNLAPRPFMGPAARNRKAEVIKKVQQAIDFAIRKG